MPYHLGSAAGALLALEAGSALVLLLLLLLEVLLQQECSPPAPGPSGKTSGRSRLAKLDLTIPEHRILPDGTCADVMRTTNANVRKLLGEQATTQLVCGSCA